MYSRFKDRAAFALVQVENGHAEPAALTERAGGPGADRAAVARAGADEYGLDFPVLVDGPGAEARVEFGAYPGRLVIVDRAGRVGFDSGPAQRSDLDPAGA